jgi:hypothetical protein
MYSSTLFSPDLYGLRDLENKYSDSEIYSSSSGIDSYSCPTHISYVSKPITKRSEFDSEEVIKKTELFIHSNRHLPISSNPMLIIVIIIIIIIIII